VQLTLHPARANSGIVFVRSDFGEPVEIPARSSEVVSTALATKLGRGDATVGTVEHLLSALYGCASTTSGSRSTARSYPLWTAARRRSCT
jgi:UDP-3-O-[3-hydroxymyristoyl] N-acetylglucosamine deacetylase